MTRCAGVFLQLPGAAVEEVGVVVSTRFLIAARTMPAREHTRTTVPPGPAPVGDDVVIPATRRDSTRS